MDEYKVSKEPESFDEILNNYKMRNEINKGNSDALAEKDAYAGMENAVPCDIPRRASDAHNTSRLSIASADLHDTARDLHDSSLYSVGADLHDSSLYSVGADLQDSSRRSTSTVDIQELSINSETRVKKRRSKGSHRWLACFSFCFRLPKKLYA